MSLKGLLKTGIVLGNVAFLTGGYVVFKMIYDNYVKLKKESQRLKKGGQSNYQYLVDAFHQENKLGDVVEIDNLSFIGTSQPISNETYVHSKVNNRERYICVKGVLHEYNKDIIQTQWIKAFNLIDKNDHQVQIQVKSQVSFMPKLFKRISKPRDDHITGQQVKEAFSVKVSESGIAFGSNLYVFGKFIKNKMGQFQCVETTMICDANDAISETKSYSNILLIGATCVATFCLLISGVCIYFTFFDTDEKNKNKKTAIKN